MPHFGLMDEAILGPVAGPLQRARLHIRGGRRRLSQGKISAGIVTLFDALSAAMESYAAAPERRSRLHVNPGEKLEDDKVLFEILSRSGVIDGGFDFAAFDRLMETALNQELNGYDYRGLVREIEILMEKLGVMPFEEASLPPEDPKTF